MFFLHPNVPDRHPLEVGANSIHLAGINSYLATGAEERVLSVVESAETIPVAVVRKFCSKSAHALTGWRHGCISPYHDHPMWESKQSPGIEAADPGPNGTATRLDGADPREEWT